MMHRSLGCIDLTNAIIREGLWKGRNSIGPHREATGQSKRKSRQGRLVAAVPIGILFCKSYGARSGPDYEYRSKCKPLGDDHRTRDNQCKKRDRSHCRPETLNFDRRLVQRFSYETGTASAFIGFSSDRASATRTKHFLRVQWLLLNCQFCAHGNCPSAELSAQFCTE